MIPKVAIDAGHQIARIMHNKRAPGALMSDYSTFEEIYDEIASGHPTYGRSDWTRFIQTKNDSEYWYKRIRSYCFAELRRKEAFTK